LNVSVLNYTIRKLGSKDVIFSTEGGGSVIPYACALVPQAARVVVERIPSLCTAKATVFWDSRPSGPLVHQRFGGT
jgi:hypothetical protein